jgi:glycosyltransferase involved in cell wall biosynthesis
MHPAAIDVAPESRARQRLEPDLGARPRQAARISCVVPCFNEAANLRELLPQLTDFLRQRFSAWEIVLVDDGSTDDTGALLEEWSHLPQVHALQFSRNFGKEAALSAGLEAAEGDAVVLLDADLQHPPELIDEMVRRWRAGADVVYALREHRQDEGRIKRLGTKVFYSLINAGERVKLPADAGDFRLMDRRVVDALLALPERNRFMKGLYAWVGFHAESVPYTPAPRPNGTSKFNARRLLRMSIDGLTGFTTLPLRAVSLLGLVMAILAFVYGAFLVASYFLYGHNVSGWTTIVVCLLLFSGVQLVSVGVLGAYVARIFEEVKGRPLYVLKRRIGQRYKDQMR